MGEATILDVDGREVRITSPDKVMFPAAGLTKRDLLDYHLQVAELLLPHCRDRPLNLERFPRGVAAKGFVQKRVPESRPDWLRTVEVTFGSGRTAEELCPASIADVLWAVNLGCVSVHPWSITVHDTQHPDELRIDLDPSPGVPFEVVRQVTVAVGALLDELGIDSVPKTSGSSGMHVLVRLAPTHGYVDVRRAAGALARELERRLPERVTSSWWKEERGDRVFVDYNQNLWDRTMACAYAVRPTVDARVSTPLSWDEVADVDPARFTLTSVGERFAQVGDLTAPLDEPQPLEPLLEMADADRAAGLAPLPLPPHYPKLEGEPTRVPPSRAAQPDGRE